MTTSAIRLEMSRAVKQELHSLANYMHSNLTDRQITQTFTRHFAGKVCFATLQEIDSILSWQLEKAVTRR